MTVIFVLTSVFLFIFGTAIGSFLNVIIYRSIQDESWVSGRSKCEHCKKPIAWYDNIPLLSYCILRGKCRQCESKISISHLVVESLTGTLFVWWYWGGSLFFKLTQQPFAVLQPLFWLFVAVILVLIFFTDYWYYLIPDIATVLLFVATVLYRSVLLVYGEYQASDLYNTVVVTAGITLFFFLLWYLTKGKGMGFGDVKLVVPLGLLLGWPNSLVAMMLAFILGAVVGVILLLFSGKSMKHAVPFGPFLIIGTAIALLWGDVLVQNYWLLLL